MAAHSQQFAVIILAAGLGTRMKSPIAKVLHKVMGKPMILYVVETAARVAGDQVIIVVGHQADQVQNIVRKEFQALFAYQAQQLGTGHAVASALPKISDKCHHVIILCGDVPLITTETIDQLIIDHIQNHRHITVLGVEVDDPTGYGRILMNENHQVYGIVEESDAAPAQKRINIINTGIYCIEKAFLTESLPKIQAENAQGEYYLTDIIEVGYQNEKIVGAMLAKNSHEFVGVNDRNDLLNVETLLEGRLRNKP
jgi:UDP-N-acetylglucosamine diphosphorylase/glucosamine-1-phosphate N-acetyltransferase